jgi:THO complex subunit 7
VVKTDCNIGHLIIISEDVIRRRLLIDGDGTGDDRRLNLLLKSFIKWCNAPQSPEDDM